MILQGDKMPKEANPKEYHFSVSQTIKNYGSVSIEAETLKEAEKKLESIKQSSVDWYTDDYTEQMENAPLSFELESVE
jgi:hypothetical protein